MLRITLICMLGLALPTLCYAQVPTWSADVAPIIFRSCVSCHHQDGIGPFSLTTFQDAATRAFSIGFMVSQRKMPPYPADTKYRRYAHERTLSDADIATVAAWVQAGAPSGDLASAPKPPTISTGPVIKAPDLVVTMPTYTSKANKTDVYRCFTMRTNEPRDMYIDALEILPGNSSAVHHVLVFVDTTDATEKLDAADPEPGYESFGGVGSSTADLLGLYAPGALPMRLPAGFGQRLPKGARIIFQMHYPAGTIGAVDATSLRLKFSNHSNVRSVLISPVLNQSNLVNGPLFIPANTVKTFRQRYTVPVDVSVLGIAPHMHLIGKSTKVWATLPNSTEVPLVQILDWDFHWQMAYIFPTLLRLQRNSVINSEVVYDNTTANHKNPNSPPRNVSLGESTTDEMILTFIYYTAYAPGDESIRLDTPDPSTSVASHHEKQALTITPNPASGMAMCSTHADAGSHVSLRVINTLGQVVTYPPLQVQNSGAISIPFGLEDSGVYSILLEIDGRLSTGQVINIR